ncbi:MAG: aldolase [Candidatus Babeliales bacterium]
MPRNVITDADIVIPADVPKAMHATFIKNYQALTKNTGRFFVFACDQKMEHLNQDFFGSNVHPDALHPTHIFKIAQNTEVGCLATHPGLIARYAQEYTGINYVAKLNGKSPLVPLEQQDPLSKALWSVDQVVHWAQCANIPVRGIGYTLYLGSEFENNMLQEAAQIIYNAHQHGLVTILWIYVRGKAIQNDQDGMITAGACGFANSLGADVVKVKPPLGDVEKTSTEWLAVAAQAAGNTKVICAGGSVMNIKLFLQQLNDQIKKGHASGCATGRNIFQRSYTDAVNACKAIAEIVYEK